MQDQASQMFVRSCTDIRSNGIGSSSCQLIELHYQDHNGSQPTAQPATGK